MSDTLLLLGYEHENFGELLSLIDEQRRNLEKGGPVDIDLLLNVAEYFSGYPDECHHPVEDLVLRRLCMRDSDSVQDPGRLSKDHLEIADLTKHLMTTLAQTTGNDNARTPELGKVMEEFVDYYRSHMRMEEEQFFAAAEKALTPEDWEEIDFGVFGRDDPLFDGSVHVRFHKLRKKIEKSASAFRKRSTGLRQVKRVQRLGSICDFNKLMLGKGLLVHYPQGGYELVLDGQPVMDIPECSETRAVWCTYYFLQGKTLGEKDIYPSTD